MFTKFFIKYTKDEVLTYLRLNPVKMGIIRLKKPYNDDTIIKDGNECFWNPLHAIFQIMNIDDDKFNGKTLREVKSFLKNKVTNNVMWKSICHLKYAYGDFAQTILIEEKNTPCFNLND
jgi:RNA recognition motif-containing protein